MLLFCYCLVVQVFMKMSQLLPLQTLESVHMHCELGKSQSYYILLLDTCIKSQSKKTYD